MSIEKSGQSTSGLPPENSPDLKGESEYASWPVEARGLVQELRTHQIELEHQNEELRVAQDELLKARNALFELFELAPVGYITVGEKSRIQEANLLAEQMLGLERNALRGRLFTEFIAEDDQDIYYRHRSVIGERGDAPPCEVRLRKADGSDLWVELQSARAEKPASAPGYGLRISIGDASEKHRAQASLERAAREWENTFQSIEDAILVTDGFGKVTRFNGAASRLFDKTGPELLGQDCPTLLREGSVAAEGRFPEQSSRDRGRATFEMRRDGKHLRVAQYPFHGGGGDAGGFVYTITDKSEEYRLAEAEQRFSLQVQQTQKLESLGVLAGGVAHDFNNILAIIAANVDLAQEEIAPDNPARLHLGEVETAVRRASELTNQMLAYAGSKVMAQEEVNLSEMVREMAQLLEVSHVKKAVLVYDLGQEPRAVKGDPSSLRQIVMNLITNASEAIGHENGTITLRTGLAEVGPELLSTMCCGEVLPKGWYATLEVRDTGCGMDEDTRRRMFEPFFTTKFSGRGLGMAAVLGIVRAHGGALDIQSAPGQGTAITILLPALPGPFHVAETVDKPETEWRGCGSFLVVDDEAQIRAAVNRMLEKKGFSVLEAAGGREALELFQAREAEIVCVLLDLTMPEMDGMETYNELRRLNARVPVILSSGFSESELEEKARAFNAADYLRKPYRKNQLYRIVQTVLGL